MAENLIKEAKEAEDKSLDEDETWDRVETESIPSNVKATQGAVKRRKE